MMDFFDTLGTFDFGIGAIRFRMSSQDYNHGKVVSSQSVNLGPSFFMTVYADPCCLVALATSVLCVRRCPSATQPPQPYVSIYQHCPVFNPSLPAIACLSLQPPNHYDRITLGVVALFYIIDIYRAAFYIATVRQCGVVRYRAQQAAGRPTSSI